MIHKECARRLFDVALSRSISINAGGRSFLLTYKNELHKSPVKLWSMWSRATSMAAATTTGRLKREDCRDIELDSANFSNWKILAGDSDWKDHAMGKQGAQKYRTHNLPNCNGPAIYEFAILAPIPGRASRELDPSSITIPFYLGQTKNVRGRLQNYGRNGAQLESGLGLFSEIFAGGFSIVFRCAPMKSKKEAERTEDELLAKYDFACNKKGNGDRRVDDIRRKIVRQNQEL